MAGDSRSRMVAAAAGLIGAHGMHATSFSEVLAASGAPRGSIYHHFPEGKDELARQAVSWTTEQILAHIAATPAGDPAGVLEWFVALFHQVAESSSGAAGCAVAGVAVDSDAGADIMTAAREAFAAWTGALASRLVATGLDDAAARRLAVTAVATMEGALILCRVQGNAQPIAVAGAELGRLVRFY